MAENWTLAFGRYLRELRERRGLSLNEVATLSQAFADDVQKGYLSRVENGRQRVAFSKVIALSRIYEVPADVLLERMELDLELERSGGPATEGLGFAELLAAGRQALDHGTYWEAYGYMRDACRLAGSDPLIESYADQREQVLMARVNTTTAAMHIGRHRYIRHELDFVEADAGISDDMRVLVFERQSVVLRRLGLLDESRAYTDKAIALAKQVGPDCRYLGFAYSSAAITDSKQNDLESAAANFRAAHEVFVAQDRQVSIARCLGNLSQVYVDQKNYRAARRALTAAYRSYQALGMKQAMALQRILLGELEAISGNDTLAEDCFREATRIAKEINHRVIEFKADFFLLKLTQDTGKKATARALTKKLRQLSNWIPQNLEELHQFRAISGEPESALPHGNSG